METEGRELTETEREALHDVQLAIEHVYRAFGYLLEFHHETGHAMDRFEEARQKLAAAGHDEFAAALRDDILPAGAFDDCWSYELVEGFKSGMFADCIVYDEWIRGELTGGVEHVAERQQQREWRERAQR
ncbi:hypothetical protein [Halorarius litoreus]|uniref:hypothetical protein n=1 Tax=Halorarius litoreus TaxID=2962676 RepID=UPI0020CE4521|nr:hypothetical protein [Halorarius litoreus]